MKAVVQDRYGAPDEVLRLAEIEKPAVGEAEVLVRVRAASVHPDVWHVVCGVPYVLRLMGAGLRRPRIRVPGTDVAGVVESVGSTVTRFRPGDEVFGESVRGHQWHNGGAYAEYAAVREAALELKPANITFEQAAAVPTSAFIALQALRDEGRIQQGETVLVNGAGGGVGSFVVQLAEAFGSEVTAVDGAEKLELLRSIGADQVIDYTREDFTRGGVRYDLVIDVPGNHSLSECRRVLTPGGRYVLIGHDRFGASAGRWLGGVGRAVGLLALSPFVRQLPGPPRRPNNPERLALLRELIEAGKLTPVVDRTFTLGEVPAAIRYLAEERVRGKIVIAV